MKAWALAAALLLGCTSESLLVARALFSSSDDVERVRSPGAFDTLWAFGGPSDTLLASPGLSRPAGARGLVFFDMRNQAAYRLGPEGNLLWSWGTKGEGPGELMGVRALDVEQDGSVVLVDWGNRHVVRLSADGLLLEEAPVPEQGGYVATAATLPGGRLAVASMPARSGSVLALWDGGDVGATEFPAGLGEPNLLQHQGRAVRWGDKGWVFGFGTGNGWMTFRETELPGIFPYVEHSDFPKMREVRRGTGVNTQMMERPVERLRSRLARRPSRGAHGLVLHFRVGELSLASATPPPHPAESRPAGSDTPRPTRTLP